MKRRGKSHIFLMLMIIGLVVISPNVYAGNCILGPDVTKDLAGALKIIRIVAPLLVLGLSTVDVVKALTKGDGGADLKKVFQKFGKRCIYAVLLFFLPVLIDTFMQMADVWDANGNCLEEVESNTGGASVVDKNQCMQKTDQESCDRTGGCSWSHGVCNSIGINGATTHSPQFVCQQQGKTWDNDKQTCVESGSYASCGQYDNNPGDCQNAGCSYDMTRHQCSPKN